MLAGEQLAVLPGDNHTQHLEILQQFQQSSQFQSLEQWQQILLAMHMQQHMQALQQQIQQGGPAQGGGQANNIPAGMGQKAGGTGLGPLEGGVV